MSYAAWIAIFGVIIAVFPVLTAPKDEDPVIKARRKASMVMEIIMTLVIAFVVQRMMK